MLLSEGDRLLASMSFCIGVLSLPSCTHSMGGLSIELSSFVLGQVLRIRILDEIPDKMEAEAEDAMEADDVTMLKQLEKNLLRLQLSGIAGISKVCTHGICAGDNSKRDIHTHRHTCVAFCSVFSA